ncbi:N-acetylglucosamine-6-phosphate deacetylase [Clostridium sp. 'deep sea']|uniref:N-acetylglucosamine-6-phosphate deacetylase n=1 Tax=Clostridium sp. 'deep sea' TaxID=2779445 RepID=UPI0018966493|nr:N-acetylglucosamine-6-phosphate deacetylase [Clostridium sp. 'deep sea']QOR36564.1 N-acetylglucosamine-6-phosphate deacetylase [Clostridium sp. 'deep sea']
MKAIYNAKIITPKKVITNGYLLYTNRIIEIGTMPLPIGQYEQEIDAEGGYALPGLIDIHTHGNCGADSMDSCAKSLKTICDFNSQNGITSFLPTTMTDSLNNIKNALINIRNCKKLALNSRILGAHLEGPFINKLKKGAQNEQYIVKPNSTLIDEFSDVIKIITYAPEQDNDFIFTEYLTQHYPNIVLSMGHSLASYDIACYALERGVKSATHLFNGMTSLHHREPGIVGAVLEKDIYCELIADNIHVHPAWYRIISNVKKLNKLVLISDSMKATGLSDGEYDFAGQTVVVKNNIARLKHNNSLAGSTLTLNKAILNIMKNSNLSICEVVNMASLNPATLLNINKDYGSLEELKVADIALCNEELTVHTTILAGITVYNNNKNEGE